MFWQSHLSPESQPELKTALPGPKAKAIIDRDEKRMSPSYTRDYPLCIERGEGAWVFDPDGNKFLDFCAGIAVCSTGHSHPEVVKAIQDQAARFIHMSGTDFYYSLMGEVGDKLSELSPGPCNRKIYFANSGAEAVEAALKLARFHTKRQHIISFFRSFHGRTYGAMSVTASKSIQKTLFSPLVPSVHHAHYPYPYRDMFNAGSPEACVDACIDYIEKELFGRVVKPDEVAAFLVEPLQGEGGYILPPSSFLLKLQALARKHGILIISDEVQAGIGRTGKMWGSQLHEGYDPDILTSAKGLASGMPLGAMIARECVMNWPYGAHASTYGGNPVTLAAAKVTLELVENHYMANAEEVGGFLKQGLEALQQHYPIIGEVRGAGLMIGVEMITDQATKAKAPHLRNELVQKAFYKGLLLLGCGENSIRLSPPLVITKEQAVSALSIIEACLKELSAYS